MKKNDLIKKLQAIKGNPTIVLWNGMVGDYMHIGEMTKNELVKQDKAFVREQCNLYRQRESKNPNYPPITYDEFKEIYKNRGWEFQNPWHESEEEVKRWYGKNRKRIIILNAKLRGKKNFDRAGTIEY